MEPQFINQFEVTLERYGEWLKHPIGKSAVLRRRIRSILLAFILCVSIYLFVIGIFRLHNLFWSAFGLLFFAFVLFQLFYYPKIVMKKQYALMLKMMNRTTWVRTITFADEIVCEDGNQTSRHSYSQFLKLKEDQQYFYLFMDEDLAVRILKDGFVHGSAEEFRSFFTAQNKVPPAEKSQK